MAHFAGYGVPAPQLLNKIWKLLYKNLRPLTFSQDFASPFPRRVTRSPNKELEANKKGKSFRRSPWFGPPQEGGSSDRSRRTQPLVN